MLPFLDESLRRVSAATSRLRDRAVYPLSDEDREFLTKAAGKLDAVSTGGDDPLRPLFQRLRLRRSRGPSVKQTRSPMETIGDRIGAIGSASVNQLRVTNGGRSGSFAKALASVARQRQLVLAPCLLAKETFDVRRAESKRS